MASQLHNYCFHPTKVGKNNCKGVYAMAMRTTNTFWNILYAVLVVLVILALLQLLGIFSFSVALANFIYIVVVVVLVLAVIHWAGLI